MTRTPLSGQKVKSQLDDVLNSHHAETGATWRIIAKILPTCRGRRHIVSPRAQLVFVCIYICQKCYTSALVCFSVCLSKMITTICGRILMNFEGVVRVTYKGKNIINLGRGNDHKVHNASSVMSFIDGCLLSRSHCF